MFPLPHFMNPTGTLAFRVWVSNPALAADLAGFLDATAYQPGRIAGDTLSVHPPIGVDDELARVELDIYLRMWRRRRHPSQTAEIVP
jgi:hypothetical protein